MAVLVLSNGAMEVVKAKDSKHFTVEEMYRLIGCDTVEHVMLADGRSMWLDEEGKFADPPKSVNIIATILLELSGGFPGDKVMGDVLVTDEEEVE